MEGKWETRKGKGGKGRRETGKRTWREKGIKSEKGGVCRTKKNKVLEGGKMRREGMLVFAQSLRKPTLK